MKQKIVNGRWAIVTPDVISDWDGGTGDYSVRRGWEFERFQSLQENLCYGQVLFEIGAEHGWMSALLGREFVGAENVVLFEPSPEFWINIRLIWDYNGLNAPMGCYQGFVSDVSDSEYVPGWPSCAVQGVAEIPSMAYRRIGNDEIVPVPNITIDDYVEQSGHVPDALNIDVEGAEGYVIRGAHHTLLKHRPLVWVSVHPHLLQQDHGSSKDEFLELMGAQNYVGELLGEDHEEHWLFRPT